MARFDLGLTPAEFWNLTFVEFAALCDRWEAKNERQDFNSAQICAILANCNFDLSKRGGKPFTALDFMPFKRKREEPVDPTVNLLNKCKVIFGMLGMEDRTGGASSDG